MGKLFQHDVLYEVPPNNDIANELSKTNQKLIKVDPAVLYIYSSYSIVLV